MNISLYVEKSDGNREMLDQVDAGMATEVFRKLDWDSEMQVVDAAVKEEREIYIPEFGLADQEERALVVSPVDSGKVSFYHIREEAQVLSVGSFPKNEIPGLIELFCAGDHAALVAIALEANTPRKVDVRELSSSEFMGTMASPMHRLGDKEPYHGVTVRDYLIACIMASPAHESVDAFEILDIYLAEDGVHSHMVFDRGDDGDKVVIVLQHDLTQQVNSVLGHRFLTADAYQDIYQGL